MKFKLPKFRPLRTSRIVKLISFGFTKKEAVALTKPRETRKGRKIPTPLRLSKKAKTGSPDATWKMIKERQDLINKARKQKKSIPKAIQKYYKNNGFLDEDGKLDPWAMFRYFLEESPTGRTKRPGSIDKGNVKLQKARYREKMKDITKPQKSLSLEEQVKRLQQEAARTENPTKRQQIYGQVYRLEKRMGK